tara:strand:- start:479 stop:769 length:291 start_codon:yes stop_codon:yes gene_type:complete
MYLVELDPDAPIMSVYRVEVICYEKTSEKKDELLIKTANWIRKNINPVEAVVNFDGITSLKFITSIKRRSLIGWVEDALNRTEPYYTSYSLETFDL